MADKKLNISHIVGVVCKNFYKSEFQINIYGVFNSTGLGTCDNGKGLKGMRKIFANQ